MRRPRLGSSLILLLVAGSLTARPARAEEIPVEVKADAISYDKGPDIARLTGHVEVKVKGAVITGEEIILDRGRQLISSVKPFRLIQKDDKGRDQLVEGTSFEYAIEIRRAEVTGARAVVPATSPEQNVFITADHLTSFDQGARLVGQGAMFTTCDNVTEGAHVETAGLGTVHYSVVAAILDYKPGEQVIGWSSTIHLLTAPVYWLPLFYAPLNQMNKLEGADIGQNVVEGYFIRARQPVKFNDEHDGTVFAEVIQNKGLGLGYQHNWLTGGGMSDALATPSDAIATASDAGASPPASDGQAGPRRQRWAKPILGVLNQPSQTYLFTHGIPVRGLTLLPPGLELIDSTSGGLTTQQIPGFTQSPLTGAPVDAATRGQLFTLGPVRFFEDYDFGLQHRRLLWPTAEFEIGLYDRNYYNLSQFLGQRDNDRLLRFNFADKEAWGIFGETLNLSTSGNWDDATRWDQAKSLRGPNPIGTASTRMLQVDLRRGNTALTSNNNWNVAEAPNPAAASTPTAPALITQNDTLTSNWSLTQQVLPGLTLANQVNYQQKSLPNVPTDRFADLTGHLTQTLDWGSTGVKIFRKQILNVGLTDDENNKLQAQRGTVFEILPEFEVRSNNLWDKVFPFTVATIIGNYSETTPTTKVQAAKAKFDVKASQHPLDLGLGFKSDFGGTGLEQSLYNTSDAQFMFTGKMAVTNDASAYFRPNLTYTKVITGDEDPLPFKNNTPFSQDKTSFSKVDQLTASIAGFNQPWLTTTFNGGYDFQNKSNMPLTANLQSSGSGIAGVFDYSVTLQGGYQFRTFSEAEVGKTVKGPTNEDIAVSAADVGRLFNFKGGQIASTVLGLQVQTAGGFGGDWGKETGIHQGMSLRTDLSWDFNKLRPQALTNELSFSIGDSWWWHTELALSSALDLSGANSAGSVLPITWPSEDPSKPIGVFYPLNRVMLKKDLHDFIFTLSYDRFTQGFQANLSLVAFPFGSDTLTGAFNQLGSGTVPGLPIGR